MEDLILIIIISILLVEVIFQLSWFKLYFKNGIPIFKKRYPFFGSLKEPFDTEHLEDQFRSGSTCTIYFRRFNEFECGFREKLWEIKLFNYIPVMRGVIRSDEKDQSFYIIGYLNWYVFFFIAYVLISIVIGSGHALFPLLILASAMYIIQFQRYGRIAEVAFEWLKKNR
ncbi:MAG: hypothetical protein MI862_23140 [Desulfobacterales bacterium]|nr:hypothetical protein [Desulfobacterales bacterium]